MIFALGIFGGLLLVLGSALPEKTEATPLTSKRNWIFVVGNISMLLYAVLGWIYTAAPIFFVLFETLIIISTILMMRPPSEKTSAIIMTSSAIFLGLISLSLFEGYQTLIFLAGLTAIGFGFALPPNHPKRNWAFAVGGLLISWFSYLGAAWVFFWLNLFFALFSLFNELKLRKK